MSVASVCHRLVPGLSFPFYALQSGKIDTRHYDMTGQVRYVKQEGGKGAPWYYAMKMLEVFNRTDYSKNKEFCKEFSLVRKQITQFHYSKLLVEEFFKDSFSRNGVDAIWSRLERYMENIQPYRSEGVSKEQFSAIHRDMEGAFRNIREFCHQEEHENLHEFVQNRCISESIKAYEQFFKYSGANPECYYKNLLKKTLLNMEFPDRNLSDERAYEFYQDFGALINNSWNTLSSQDKYILYTQVCLSILLERYEFKESSWTSDGPIDELISNLKTLGPQLVKGRFGIMHYDELPEEVRTIGGYPVLGWKGGDCHPLYSLGYEEFDVVSVVGAEKGDTGTDRVYFAHPNDGSDPDNPYGPVYELGYPDFVSQLQKFWNYPLQPMSISDLSKHPCGAYGYHRTFSEVPAQLE